MEPRNVLHETRATESGKERRLTGYAARYGVVSNPIPGGKSGSFRERILPGAFDGVVDSPDTVMTMNHDQNILLGRVGARTLKLSTDSKGLKFDVLLPNSSWGQNAYEAVKRGDLKGCSFAFADVEDSWDKEDGFLIRTIKKFRKLFDVAVVTTPAYAGTSISARNLVAAAEIRSRVEAFESLTATVELTPEERLDWWCKAKGLNRNDYATTGELHNAVFRRRILLNSVLV